MDGSIPSIQTESRGSTRCILMKVKHDVLGWAHCQRHAWTQAFLSLTACARSIKISTMKPAVSAPLRSLHDATDVLILGAGGAGYHGAFFLARAGLSVQMVDPIGNLGSDCLAEDCVPPKAVREAALVRGLACKFDGIGLRGSFTAVDWPAVLAHKDRVQNTRYAQHAQENADSGVPFAQGPWGHRRPGCCAHRLAQSRIADRTLFPPDPRHRLRAFRSPAWMPSSSSPRWRWRSSKTWARRRWHTRCSRTLCSTRASTRQRAFRL